MVKNEYNANRIILFLVPLSLERFNFFTANPYLIEDHPILNFSVISSGSRGNCTYIESPKAKVIIDSGISQKELAVRLKIIDRSPENLDAIFMTHEHSDHLKGIGPLARKFGIPVYSTFGAHEAGKKVIGNISDWRFFKPLDRITINDLEMEAYPTPHDAAEPVGFVARCNGFTLGQATDLGCLTPMIFEKMASADALLLEANHDVEMLEVGPYPWSLKQRVKSDSGHLSNKACAELVSKVSHDALRILVIMHISEKNNHPDIVKVTVKPCIKNSKTRFVIAEQSRPTEMFSLC